MTEDGADDFGTDNTSSPGLWLLWSKLMTEIKVCQNTQRTVFA
jgi:hypothetical protein